MDDRQFRAVLLLLIVLVSAFGLSLAFSQLTSSIRLPNTGYISGYVIAKSGSAKDIQAAVNIAATSTDVIGNVQVPAGTYNFVNVGESWSAVNVPAGVSIFGASTQRYSNGSVISWNTVLVMPWDVPGNINVVCPVWFSIVGSGNPNKSSRISDIKLEGYRSLNSSSITMSVGISISSVMDFRVDHCCLEHICCDGIATDGLNCRGVIDHCSIYNIYGWDDLGGYTDSNVGYGVVVQRDYHASFDPTMNVLGKYTNYTIFIENCYFSRWRHCVASGTGGYYVFRYNIVDYDLGHYSMDVHGVRTSGYAGGRGAEIYENTYLHVNQWIPATSAPFYNVSRNSANTSSEDYRDLFQDGGGCGVWFNNYVDTSYRSDGIALYTEDDIADPTWHLKDFYLWSTEGPWTHNSWNGPISGFSGRNVAAYWSRIAGSYGNASYPNVDPSWSIAGYTPYAYPHPLTLGT